MSLCQYRSLFWFILFLGVLCFLLSIWTLKSFTHWPAKLSPLSAFINLPIRLDSSENNVTDSEEETVSYNVITISDDLSKPDVSIQDVTETLLGDLREAESFLGDLKDDGQDKESSDGGQDVETQNNILTVGPSLADVNGAQFLINESHVQQSLSGDSMDKESMTVDGNVIESMFDSTKAKEEFFYDHNDVDSLLVKDRITDSKVKEPIPIDGKPVGYKSNDSRSAEGEIKESIPVEVKSTESTQKEYIALEYIHRDVIKAIQTEDRDSKSKHRDNIKTKQSEGRVLGVNKTITDKKRAETDKSKLADFVKNQSKSLEKELLRKDLNMTKLLKEIYDGGCLEVYKNPGSYWRSTPVRGDNLFTAQKDGERMGKAIRCGILDEEYLTTPPVPELYSFEKFYLSHPPIADLQRASSESHSSITMLSPSKLVISETIKLKIDVRDRRGVLKGFGGDEVRVWLTDTRLKHTAVVAKVEDLGNGTYLATAPAPWVGTYRVNAAVTYSREYLRALVYLQLVLKTFRHVGALFENKQASELTPCYHTELIPGHSKSDLCNMSSINGSPWFCGRPTKSQLDCDKDFAGSRVIAEANNIPATPAEIELFRLSSGAESKIFRLISNNIQFDVVTDSLSKRYITPEPACNKINMSDTWNFETPTGFIYENIWHPRYCHIPNVSWDSVYKNLEVIILGDSNGRGLYYHFVRESGCSEAKKALTKKWHKPLLCVHKRNRFTLRWEPHSQPFMNGHEIAEKGSLTASSIEIDKIPTTGRYLVIINHFFHLTTAHISSIHYKFRAIKDSLVRLVKRNSQVLVVLQGLHTAQVGWPNHYEAGDMLGHEIMRIQKEIFHEIRDKVIFLNTWDMTVAVANMDFHPSTGDQTFATLVGYISGR